MKTTRRFAVASLLVIAVAIVLGAPPPASAGKVKGAQVMQVTLYPAAASLSPKATGNVTLYQELGQVAFYALSVSVSRLAPNASYYMPVILRYRDYWGGWHDRVYNVPIQTDARGNGESGFGHSNYLIMSSLFQLYDSSGTLVLTPNA